MPYKNKEVKALQDKIRNKTYHKTPQYKKSITIRNWKRCGLIESEQYTYDMLYEAYIFCGHCELCNDKIEGRRKHMDHDHATGLFRHIVCPSCNNKLSIIDNKIKM